MARPANTYRDARRNEALREIGAIWGPQFYYEGHRAIVKRGPTKLRRKPSRYHPLAAAGAYLRSLGKPWGKKGASNAVALAATHRGGMRGA